MRDLPRTDDRYKGDNTGVPVHVFSGESGVEKTRASERVHGVESIICDEEKDGHRCVINGAARGGTTNRNHINGVVEILIDEDTTGVEEHWNALGETGVQWVTRDGTRFGKQLPECTAYSETRNPQDGTGTKIVCK